MAKNITVQTTGGGNRSWIMTIMIVVAAFIGLNILLTAFGTLISNVFNVQVNEHWRETISTDNGLRGKVNGGLTEEQIEEFENNALYKPYFEDIFRNAVVAESDNYVTIYRQIEGTEDFYNLNFVRTEKGLVYDGAVGVTTNVPYKEVKFWGVPVAGWLHGQRDFTRATTTLDTNLSLYSKSNKDILSFLIGLASGNLQRPENIVTLSDFNTTFASGFKHTHIITNWVTGSDQEKQLFEYITKYLSDKVIYPHFQTITDNSIGIDIELKNGVENVENANEVKQRLNTFATYLWENSRTLNGTSKQTVVDVSHYFGSFIPEELQSNYPLQGEDIEKFAGFENYPMYDNKVFFDVAYIKHNSEPSRDRATIDLNVEKDNNKIDEDRPENPPVTRLKFEFNDLTASDTTHLDLKTNPVVITISDNDNNEKRLVIHSMQQLIAGQSIALPSNKTYYYSINSNELIIDSTSGSITITTSPSIKVINYSYMHGFVNKKIYIVNISQFPLDDVNLLENPATIILSGLNDEGTYVFEFDSLIKAKDGISQLIPTGNYNYSILSNKFIFNPKSGVIDVTSANHTSTFLYHVNTNSNIEGLKLNIALIPESSYSSNEIIVDYSYESLDIIRGQIGNTTGRPILYLFNSENEVVITSSGGNVSGQFKVDTNGLLLNGTEGYSIQILFRGEFGNLLSNKVNLPIIEPGATNNFYVSYE